MYNLDLFVLFCFFEKHAFAKSSLIFINEHSFEHDLEKNRTRLIAKHATFINTIYFERTIIKNDVMVTGFDKIAVLFLTKVSSLVCEHG